MLGLRYTVNEARYIFIFGERKQHIIFVQPHSIARARVKHARARYSTIILYIKMTKNVLLFMQIISKCY